MNNLINRLKSFRDNPKAKIVIQFFMCLLSFIIFIVSAFSFGWFSQNQVVSVKSMQVDLKKPDEINASITVHACIGEENNGVYYFNKEVAATKELKKYMMLTKNNRQLLLRIHFEEPVAVWGISLKAATDTTYFMGDGQHPLLASVDGKGAEYDNVLSSIIAFYIVGTEETTYDLNAAYKVSSFGTPYSFINKNDYSMTNVITLIDKQTVSDIYIVLDYDPDLVSKVFSENLGNLLERADGSIVDEVFFVWDIGLELTKE